MVTRPALLTGGRLAALLHLVLAAACSTAHPAAGQPGPTPGELLLHRGPETGVEVLALSPDGGLLAANGMPGDVMLWNADDGAFLGRLSTDLQYLAELEFSPAGDLLLVRGSGPVELWDVAGRTRVEGFEPAPDHDQAVFSRAGDGVLTWGPSSPCAVLGRVGAADPALRLGAEDCEDFDAPDVAAAALSPDGAVVALARGPAVELWSAGSGERLRALETSTVPMASISFSGRGHRLIGAGGGDVLVWDASSGRLLHQVPLDSVIPREVTPVAGADQVVARGYGGSVLVDVESARITRLASRRAAVVPGVAGLIAVQDGDSVLLRGVGAAVATAAAAILNPNGSWSLSADGRRLASAWGEVVEVRETRDPGAAPRLLRDRVARPERLAVSPATDVIATVGRHGSGWGDRPLLDHLHVWDLRTGRPLWRLDGSDYRVYDLDFSPDGRALATTAFDPHTPAIRDAATGAVVHDLVDTSHGAVRFTPGGDRVLLWGNSTVLVDLRDGTRVRELRAASGGPVAPDGRTMALAAGNVRLWDLDGDTLIREIGPRPEAGRLHGPSIGRVQFHPEGDRILTGGFILLPTVYDVDTGDTVAVFDVPEPTSDEIVEVAALYSPDGGAVLTRIESGTEAWLWSTGGMGPPADRIAFMADAPVLDAAFACAGRLLVTTHSDASTRVWDARTGEPLIRRYLVGEAGWVVITPDGRYDGSPDALGDLLRVRGGESRAADPATDPDHVPDLMAEVMGRTGRD